MNGISPTVGGASYCPLPWIASIPTPPRTGPGSLCFPPPGSVAIRGGVPNAIADLFEADVFAAKDLAQEGLLGVESERAGATDATDFHVRGVGRRNDALGIDARRGHPERRGRAI